MREDTLGNGLPVPQLVRRRWPSQDLRISKPGKGDSRCPSPEE